MSEIGNRFVYQASEGFTFRLSLLVVACLYCFSHVLHLYPLRFGPYDFDFFFRVAHLFINILVIILIAVSGRKLKRKMAVPLMLTVFLPAYVLCWTYSQAIIASEQIFPPFNIFRIHFVILALIVPASYLLNFILLMGFAIEAVVMWFYMDLPHAPRMALGGEPNGIIVAFVVSVAILILRYRDDQMIRHLITKEARAEIITKIARTFLSIRDRSNTPLQTLMLTTQLLKKNYPQDSELLQILEKNIKRLKDTNQILMSLEDRISWQGKELMTDGEILQWISEFHEK